MLRTFGSSLYRFFENMYQILSKVLYCGVLLHNPPPLFCAQSCFVTNSSLTSLSPCPLHPLPLLHPYHQPIPVALHELNTLTPLTHGCAKSSPTVVFTCAHLSACTLLPPLLIKGPNPTSNCQAFVNTVVMDLRLIVDLVLQGSVQSWAPKVIFPSVAALPQRPSLLDLQMFQIAFSSPFNAAFMKPFK